MWYPLKDACEALGIKARWNETERKVTIDKTGSTIRLVGADDKREIDKLRGQSFHEVQIDEAASYPTDLLDALLFRIVGPRLGDLNGVIVMFGTPGHILAGPFYEATRPGSATHRPWADRNLPEFAGWLGWSSHTWTLEDGAQSVPAMARLWREALREKEANGWTDDNPIWLREYRGQWAADDTTHMFRYRPHVEGDAWNQWEPERAGPLQFAQLPSERSDWIYGYGLDMGTKDPFALNVFAISPGDPERRIFHVYGFERRDMYARTIAELLVGHDAVQEVLAGRPMPSRLGGLYGITDWPAAIRADLANLGEAVVNELANVYGIRILAAQKKDKFGNIEVVNGQLVEGRLRVLKGSTLEQQLSSLQWRPDEYGQPKEDKSAANHSTDSMLYIVPELLKLFEVGATAPPRQPGAASPQVEQSRRALHEPSEPEPPRNEFGGLLEDSAYDDVWG